MLTLNFICVLTCILHVLRGIQRGSGEVQDGVWDRAKCRPGLFGWKDKDQRDDPERTDTGSYCTHQQPTSRAAGHEPILVFSSPGTCVTIFRKVFNSCANNSKLFLIQMRLCHIWHYLVTDHVTFYAYNWCFHLLTLGTALKCWGNAKIWINLHLLYILTDSHYK